MTTLLLEFDGVPASHCVIAAGRHRPVPARHIWHHILPQVCGGKTERSNLVQLCDNCHYSIHRWMWCLQNGGLPKRVNKRQLALAQAGYDQAVAAGTADKIPKESGGT
jgi:hypothetical protein